ncbi:protein N-terminal asparagine amidohydrolase [Petromyzon marinus]|uniref:Protein N-terminal asparagine amidohydrolase n=1 Tax=Petromyzon marinus TaxID=7757 RepID=A0AAJ7XF31_PETMA|nr:protein N-terminal asparagine amidohydrolase [Petromyzon marinus]
MPLLVGGEALGACPSTRSFIEKYGAGYQADAAALRAQPVRTVGPEGLVYVHQGEMAATEPTDDAAWLLGSEEATTCHLVVLRHSGSGAVCLGHFDGSGTAPGARAVVDHVLALSPTQSPGRLELHVIGGFEDERGISQRLTLDVLDAFSQQKEEIHLVTFCASELNDELREGHHWPVIYGIAVDVRAGSLFRARFPDKGPDRALRNSRNHGDNKMGVMYCRASGELTVQPIVWTRWDNVTLWLVQPDDVIRQFLSTSPLVEPPDFAANMRQLMRFMLLHPEPSEAIFPAGAARRYRRGPRGSWQRVP